MPKRPRQRTAVWLIAVSVLAIAAVGAAVGVATASRDAPEAAVASPTTTELAPAVALHRAREFRTQDAVAVLGRARKTAGHKKMEPGERGDRVRTLQDQLVKLDMLRTDQVDGSYGDATQHAVMAFQKLNGLDRDGVAGPKTIAAVMRGGKKPAPFAKGEPDRVEVNLSLQLVQVIEGGKVKRVVSAASGMPGFDTPPGTFAVYDKNPNAYSYIYDAPMPMASFFDGHIGLHQSADVPGYPASHGCIRLPAAFATEVYDFAEMGRQVIVVA